MALKDVTTADIPGLIQACTTELTSLGIDVTPIRLEMVKATTAYWTSHLSKSWYISLAEFENLVYCFTLNAINYYAKNGGGTPSGVS